jgi:hypothetical protein
VADLWQISAASDSGGIEKPTILLTPTKWFSMSRQISRLPFAFWNRSNPCLLPCDFPREFCNVPFHSHMERVFNHDRIAREGCREHMERPAQRLVGFLSASMPISCRAIAKDFARLVFIHQLVSDEKSDEGHGIQIYSFCFHFDVS